jgi:cobalt ECF transporter T component CbiQ
VISAGIVAWLQRTDPSLLETTAPDAPDIGEPLPPQNEGVLLAAPRKFWLGLAALLILTPLGILAVGSAWGEWGPQDFADPQVRQEIAAASGNHAPPARPPSGLERLSSIWTAPLSSYAPSFIRSASFGYFVSAAVGVGLIIALCSFAGWLAARGRKKNPLAQADEFQPVPGRRRRRGFVEKTMLGLLDAMRYALFAENLAASGGLLQRLDPRVKLVGITALIVAAVAVHRLPVLVGIFAAGVVLGLLSHVSIRVLATRVWGAVLAFTGVIALPAIFLTPGDVLYRLPALGWPVTHQGLSSAAFLVLRAETAATLSMLLILCTLWTHLLRALRFFRVPVVLVVTLGMTYRYVFLFLQAAKDMFESREARLVGSLDAADRRRLAAAGAGVLLGKSIHLSGEVHTAMLARGFRGEVHLLEDLRIGSHDWLRLAAFLGAASAAVWLGR